MNLSRDFSPVFKNKKGLLFLVLFRFSSFFAKGNIVLKIVGFPIRIFYLVFVQWILGIDIPDRTKIGYGFNVWHGQGLIIHPDCKIGNFVQIRHNTTIGQRRSNEAPPEIGNSVDIGAHSIIIGDIKIGDNCVIGAGTFVNKDIPENSVVYGNPMVIKSLIQK